MSAEATTIFELTAVSAIAAAISAVVTAVSAVGVFLQVRAATASNAAQLYVSFSDRYNAPEMATALRSLASWRIGQHQTDFAQQWARAKDQNDSEALRLNESRRLVSRFYFDVARLYGAKLITEQHARALISNNGLNVFYKVCEPMNLANHPNRVSHYSEILGKLSKSYGDGSLHVRPQIRYTSPESDKGELSVAQKTP